MDTGVLRWVQSRILGVWGAVPDFLSLPILMPLIAGALYTLGAMLQKRAFHEGAGLRQVVHVTNLTLAGVFLPFIFFEKTAVPWELVGWPLGCGMAFYLASICTVLAIRKGDVSLVTPVLGAKVVIVAIGSVALIGQQLSGALWWAAVLTSAGVFLLGGNAFFQRGKGKRSGAILKTVGLTLLSAIFFAMTDVWLGGHAKEFGPLAFISVMIVSVGVFSVALNPLLLRGGDPAKKGLRTIPGGARKWVIGGALLVALQAVFLGLALALFRDPTGANILYSSRGLWAVIGAWLLPELVGIPEFSKEKGGTSLLVWRFSGTVLLMAGIVVAVIARE